MDDLISREDAIDAVKAFLHNEDDWFQEAAASQIRRLPSADRPTGEWKWEQVENETGHIISAGYNCDQCGAFSRWKENFCPDCGADMRK